MLLPHSEPLPPFSVVLYLQNVGIKDAAHVVEGVVWVQKGEATRIFCRCIQCACCAVNELVLLVEVSAASVELLPSPPLRCGRRRVLHHIEGILLGIQELGLGRHASLNLLLRDIDAVVGVLW